MVEGNKSKIQKIMSICYRCGAGTPIEIKNDETELFLCDNCNLIDAQIAEDNKKKLEFIDAIQQYAISTEKIIIGLLEGSGAYISDKKVSADRDFFARWNTNMQMEDLKDKVFLDSIVKTLTDRMLGYVPEGSVFHYNMFFIYPDFRLPGIIGFTAYASGKLVEENRFIIKRARFLKDFDVFMGQNETLKANIKGVIGKVLGETHDGKCVFQIGSGQTIYCAREELEYLD